MRKIATILLFIGLFHLSYAQSDVELRPEIRKLVKKMEKDNMYKSSAVGYAGVRTDQWKRFEKIRVEATEEELIILTDHQNPAVRSYAFQALAEHKSESTFEILLNHVTDTAQVRTFQGCIVSSQTVGDFFMDVVTPQYISLDAYKLNRRERKTVDSLLLYNDKAKIRSRSTLLQKLEKDESNYERIRKIYLKERDPNALVALSKFNLEKDKQFIIDWLTKAKTRDQYHGLKAARHFLSDDIYPYLMKIHEKEINKPGGFNYPLIRMLYFVLAQYKTAETRKLFEMSLETKGSTYIYHSQYLWLALEKYPDPVFDGLQDQIRLNEFQLTSVSYWLEHDDG